MLIAATLASLLTGVVVGWQVCLWWQVRDEPQVAVEQTWRLQDGGNYVVVYQSDWSWMLRRGGTTMYKSSRWLRRHGTLMDTEAG